MNYGYGFEVKETGQGYHVAKPGFDLMISGEFLRARTTLSCEGSSWSCGT